MPLPAHWTTAPLGDLVDVYDAARVPLNKRQRLQFQGPYPYYGANGIVDRVADYLFDGVFILIAEDGGHFDDPTRTVATKVEGRFWVNNHAHVVRAREDVDPSYLAYALRTVNWMDFVGGSTRLKLTQASLKTLPIPMTSAAEQVRLAARLADALGKAERASEALAKAANLLDAYRVSITTAALSGALTRRWRAEAGAQDWKEARLGDRVKALDYGSSAKSAKMGTVPVLRMGNIKDGRLDWTDLVYTSDPREIEKYQLNRGDVLFNRTNSAELVGKTALYDDERPAIHAGYLIRIVCGPDLSPAFLTHLLNGPEARAYFGQVRSDGVNQSNINASKVADLRFQMPSLEEQQEIVRQLDRALAWVEDMRAHVRASRHLLGRLRVGVVAKGFQGELTFAEPEDEHVELLLARLASETPETRANRLAADREILVRKPAIGRMRSGQGVTANGKTRTTDLREGLLSLGGEAPAAELWALSGLAIDTFYKRLRAEISAGRIREGHKKGRLVVGDAS